MRMAPVTDLITAASMEIRMITCPKFPKHKTLLSSHGFENALPEADDKVTLVVHLLGRRNPEGLLLREDEEPVFSGRSGHRRALFFPVGQQLSQGMRL